MAEKTMVATLNGPLGIQGLTLMTRAMEVVFGYKLYLGQGAQGWEIFHEGEAISYEDKQARLEVECPDCDSTFSAEEYLR